MLRISGHILSKVTSSFMVLTSDGQKANLGLSLKYEAKSLKVIGYSRKDGKVWEYSQAAVDLIREYKVTCNCDLSTAILIDRYSGKVSRTIFKNWWPW